MKNLFLSGFALLAVIVARPAIAADTDWRGFYVGGNAGYGQSVAENALNISDGSFITCHFCDNIIAGGPTVDHLIAQDEGSPRLKPRGFSGGVQFGYNWQSANWVYGAEIAFGAFQQRDTVDRSFVLPGNTGLAGGGVCGATGPETCIGKFSTKLQTDWLLTIRPRVGYAFDNTLVYGTFGLAVTRLTFEQTYTDNITYPLVPGSTGAGGFVRTSSSAVRTALVVGAGVEQALGQRWSIKAEYLFMRFGGISAAGRLTDGFGGLADFSNRVDHLSSNLVRLGLNYKFDGSMIIRR